MGNRILNLRSQVRKRGKIGLNQSIIFTLPFPPFSRKFFYLPLFNSVTKKSILREKKHWGGGHLLSLPLCSMEIFGWLVRLLADWVVCWLVG
jgi:hypothetical protein